MADGEPGTGPENSDEVTLEDELEEIFELRQQRRKTIKAVVFGIIGVATFAMLVRSVSLPRFRTSDAFAVGKQATISMASILAMDNDALSDLNDLQAADDQVGLNMLLQSGRAFMLNEGTDILIEDSRFNTVMVRALEGPNSGKTGWVQTGRIR
jgi:hypothetical protein